MHQRDELDTIGRRIGQREVSAGQGHKLRVPDLIKLAIGKPQLEGFEGLSPQPFPNCVRVHRLCLSKWWLSRLHYSTLAADSQPSPEDRLDMQQDVVDHLVYIALVLVEGLRMAKAKVINIEVEVRLLTDSSFAEREEGIPSLYERLKDVAGKAEGLPPDLAANHDHYLHGRARQ